MSMFDRGARSSVKLDFVNQPNLTHQYQNLANNFQPEKILMSDSINKICKKQEELFIPKQPKENNNDNQKIEKDYNL